MRLSISHVHESSLHISRLKPKARRICVRPWRNGAVEKTRTSTGAMPTATSTLRVYQFRHDRKGLATTTTVVLLPQCKPASK